MKYPVAYKSRAKSEVKSAILWYERQQKGLGEKFLASLENAVDKIRYNPFAYPEIHKNFRRILLKRFPYSLFYLFENDTVYIFSVFNSRQNPEKLP